MFQIGETLRRARSSRGLELEEVAHDTMIRPKHLAALEEERFDLLPGAAYARGFLREYAQYLGLRPEPFLEELDARARESAEPEPPLRLYGRPRRRLRPRIALALAGGAGLAAAVVLAGSHPGKKQQLQLAPAPPPPVRHRVVAAPRPVVHARRVAAPRPERVRLLAAGGDCWLSVRSGSQAGAVLYEGLLRRGGSLTFRLRPLWIRIGAPWNLEVRLGARRLGGMPPSTASVLLTRSGLRLA